MSSGISGRVRSVPDCNHEIDACFFHFAKVDLLENIWKKLTCPFFKHHVPADLERSTLLGYVQTRGDEHAAHKRISCGYYFRLLFVYVDEQVFSFLAGFIV